MGRPVVGCITQLHTNSNKNRPCLNPGAHPGPGIPFFANHSEAMRTPRPMVAHLEWNNIGLAAFVAPNAQLLPVASCLRCRRRVVVTPPHTRQIIQEPWHPPDHRDSHHPTAKGYPRTAWAIKNVYAAAPVCTSGTAIYLKMLPSLVARCGARGCSSAKRHTNPARHEVNTRLLISPSILTCICNSNYHPPVLGFLHPQNLILHELIG
jgi:hypothetical protein